MPPRPALPQDDLYVRLGVPTDSSVEAIELAWRALLRRHHPDIAGPEGLESAKRINVAHDWLSDPALRARYDRERGLRHAVSPRGDGRRARHARWAAPPEPPRTRHREPDAQTAIDRFLARVAALTPTEIDRLSLAEPPPIAFGATIRRFLSPDRLAALETVEAAVVRALPPAADRPAIRDAIDGYATELVLGPFLDELLSEPFRARTHERLTRGWDAAIGQPRYGPNGTAVTDLLSRLSTLDEMGVRALSASWTGLAGFEPPWPPGLSAIDDEGLRVSSALAARDAMAAVPTTIEGPTLTRARRAAGWVAHLVVLRHAFDPGRFTDLTTPWRPWLVAPSDVGSPRVRRPITRS